MVVVASGRREGGVSGGREEADTGTPPPRAGSESDGQSGHRVCGKGGGVSELPKMVAEFRVKGDNDGSLQSLGLRVQGDSCYTQTTGSGPG